MDDKPASAPEPHPLRCAAALRREAPHHGWTTSQLVEVIVQHCGHTRLRAHRLAHGWTLATLITEMTAATGIGHRLVASRVSRWERDEEHPSAPYRDALCQVYRTGPVDLGLNTDYSLPTDTAPATAVAILPRFTSDGPWPPMPAHGDRDTTGTYLAGRADQVRRRVDEALSASTVSDTTVAHKEAIAEQYGRTYKTEAAGRFLTDILADLDDVRAITDRKLPSAQRRDLCAVTARLAGLVSMTMVNLGQYRQAREWGHTARLAADEASDAHLRAWVATRAAVAALHLGDPHAAAHAAREAEILTRHLPGPITAMAWAVLARAAALMRDRAAARTALAHAEKLYATISTRGDNTAYQFTTGQLHFYRSHALTTIGETGAAWQAQDDALAAFGPNERLDPTLVHLDRALCMVSDGNVDQGSDYATTILLRLPLDHRPAIVTRRAHAVATAVPPTRRGLPAVRALHEVLAISAAGT